jgi:DNA-binding SARP family transcriptional activator
MPERALHLAHAAGIRSETRQGSGGYRPFRETGYQLLMRAHAAVGNRAEALRVYERCRSLLSEELGVPPSSQTEAVYLDILRS